jgi:capsid protein
MSRAAALTYEEFTGDWAGATFSSSKMGVATNWPRILYRRNNIVAPLAQDLLQAFIEEDIEIGGTPFPGGVDGFPRQPRGRLPGVLARPVDAAGRRAQDRDGGADHVRDRAAEGDRLSAYGVDPDDAADERARERDYEEALDLEPGTTFSSPTDRAAAQKLVAEPPPKDDAEQDPAKETSNG